MKNLLSRLLLALILCLSILGQNLQAATFPVTNTNDSGSGSLREAILSANTTLGRDTITFTIGSGSQSLIISTNLPTITDDVRLDGTTQGGYAGIPLITIPRFVQFIGVNALQIEGLAFDGINSGVFANSTDGVRLRNLDFSNINTAISINTGSDVDIQSCSFNNNFNDIRLSNITSQNLPRGILIRNNSYNSGRNLIDLTNVPSQLVSDASIVGSSVEIPNAGLAYTGIILSLSGADSSVIRNLNLSGTATTAASYCLRILNSDSILVQNNQFGNAARGVELSGVNRGWIQNNTLNDNNTRGIAVFNGSDIRVLNNSLSNSGTAIYLNGIAGNLLPQGVLVNSNSLSGGNIGLDLLNLPRGQVLSNGSYPGTNINVSQADLTLFRSSALQLSNVDSSIIANLNLSDGNPSNFFSDYGIFATGCDSLSVINCDFSDRGFGVDARNMADISITNSTFANNNIDAIRLTTISSASLPRGIAISGNSFNGGGTGISINGAPPQVIGNTATAGANILLASNDLSGFRSNALEVSNSDSLLLSNLNFIGLGRTQSTGALFISNVDSALIENIQIRDCQRGMDADRVSRFWVRNNVFDENGSFALDIFDGRDVHLLNNSFTNISTAIRLNTIRRGQLSRGVEVIGNSLNNGGTGLSLSNMVRGQVISDGSYPGTNIVIPASALTSFNQYGLFLSNVDSSIVANLNMNDTSSSIFFDYGISTTGCDSLAVLNCSLQNRSRGFEGLNGSDFYLRNNSFGSNINDAARFSGVSGRNIPRGIAMTANSFNGGGTGLDISQAPPQVISDGSIPNSNIVLGVNDLSGFSGYAIEIATTDSSVIANLNLSGLGNFQSSGGILAQNCDSLLVQNNNLGNSSIGFNSSRMNQLWLSNNSIANSGNRGVRISIGTDIHILNNGFSNNATAISLNSITAQQTARGVDIASNTFNGGTVGLEITNTHNQIISEGGISGTNILLNVNDLRSFSTYPISLSNTDSLIIANLNLSHTGSNPSFASIFLGSGDSALIRNNVMGNSSMGVDINSSNRVWLENNTFFDNSSAGIDIGGGSDIRIINNSLSNSGTAIVLNSILAGQLSRGIRLSGNSLNGGTTALSLSNLPSGQIISDGMYPNTNISLNTNDVSSFRTSGIIISSTDSLIIANLNLSDTTSSSNFGYGIRASSCDSLALINCNLADRSTGFEGNRGRDYSIRNCNFANNSNTSIQIFNIQSQDIPRGIAIDGNTFSRGGTGIYLFETPPQVISNGSYPNSNIILDSLSLIDFSRYAIQLGNVDSTIISNLNLSGPSVNNKLASIFLQDADSVLIQNCVLGDASRGLDMSRCSRSWIRSNSIINSIGISQSRGSDTWLLGNSFSNNPTAILLNSIASGRIAGGIRTGGNTFNGGTIGISLNSCPPQNIGDGSLPGENIALGVNDLTSFTTYGIFVSNTDSVTVSGINLGNLVSTNRTGIGLFLSNSDHIRMDGLRIQNRATGISMGNSSFDTLSCSQLLNNGTGVSMGNSSNNNRIFDCRIEGNLSGIQRFTATASDSLNAENNFWGASNGPLPLGGSGDNFTGLVDASPFLAAAPACIGLDTCSLQLTSTSASCLGNSDFEVNLAFTGAGNTYRISNGNTVLLDSIPAGSYTVGPFPRGTAVNFLLSDLRFSSCDTSFSLINSQSISTQNRSICEGDSLPFGGQFLSAAGTYRDSLLSNDGCDSIIVLNLSVIPVGRTNQSVQICQGQSFNFGGRVLTVSGTYLDTLTSVSGCDSISSLDLTVSPSLQTGITQSICEGDSIVFGGRTLRIAGTYVDSLVSASGCDSIVNLTLTINPVFTQNLNVAVCSNQLPFNFGGRALTAAGTYVDSLQSSAGCDSLIILSLSVNLPDTTLLSNTSCNPASVGVDTTVLVNQSGCDSVVITTTSLLASDTTNLAASICDNQSFSFNGLTLTTAGNYQVILTNRLGCDSVVNLNLSVNPTYSTSDSAFICQGQTFTFGSQRLDSSGTYTEIFTSSQGCDSVVNLRLSVGNQVVENLSASICQGQSFTFGSQILTTSGTYTETFTSNQGCDSVVSLRLSVGNQVVENLNASICQGQSIFFGGQARSTSGIYTDTLLSSTACDSIVILTLTVDSVINQNLSLSLCSNQLPFNFGGQLLTSPGIYIDSLQSSAGCDSLVTLNLMVSLPDTTIIHNTSCDSSQAGTDTTLWVNQFGCDSLVITNTSVLGASDTTFLEVFICENETYNFNGLSLKTAGNYQISLSNQAGCDSIVILDLGINPTYLIQQDSTINPGDTLIFGGQIITNAGSYQDTLQSTAGCDSVIKLMVLVNNSQGLAAPSKLVIGSGTALLAKLSWKDNSSNEDGFRIIRDGVVIDSVGPNISRYVDTVYVFAVTVTYEVEAYRQATTSARSNQATFINPPKFKGLKLNFVCYDAGTDSLTWKVTNPNRQAHPYIYAQWWSPQRDTLFALPGDSYFRTKNNPQSPATFGDDNITGIWWVDHRLLPGVPNSVITSNIKLNIPCQGLRLRNMPRSPKAGDIFKGSLARSISFKSPDITNDILANDLKVMPNPFSTNLTLRTMTLKMGALVRITNIAGQELMSLDVDFVEDVKIDLSHLASGYYFLEVRMAEAIFREKIVKK
ncbi:MAG: right-handed parallel beta-helix repeat-containing protein [Bacteroidia bacterium]|nr:right-handed parallel beta-helix repeat-containing protein [Bacteroidia bacterium]